MRGPNRASDRRERANLVAPFRHYTLIRIPNPQSSFLEPAPYRVLVLGGYGNFGARIARALAAETSIHVIVAGRDVARAHAFLESLSVAATPPTAAALDCRSNGFASALAALGPSLVIHTAGPFQGQDYTVAEMCIDAGVHYIDLADGRAFVCGIEALDSRARTRGVLVCAGASTLPAVSSAVVDALLDEFGTLDSIEITIAPGQRAPRGEATLAAVLSYCGKPFVQLRRGKWRTVYGWQAIRRGHFRALAPRWASACDVPDLELFPRRYPRVQTVRFAAALEVAAEQWGLWLMAAATRLGLVADWSRYAGVLLRGAGWVDRFGSDLGGMSVVLRGQDASGRPLGLDWELIAPAGQGPEIPCIPAVVLARRLAAGTLNARGAMPCMGLMSRDDFVSAASRFGITATVERSTGP